MVDGVAPAPLRDEGQVEGAMSALFYYRVDMGLEAEMVHRRRRLDQLPYPDMFMCSENTQTLGDVYMSFIYNSMDLTWANQKWTVWKVISWIEETYVVTPAE